MRMCRRVNTIYRPLKAQQRQWWRRCPRSWAMDAGSKCFQHSLRRCAQEQSTQYKCCSRDSSGTTRLAQWKEDAMFWHDTQCGWVNASVLFCSTLGRTEHRISRLSFVCKGENDVPFWLRRPRLQALEFVVCDELCSFRLSGWFKLFCYWWPTWLSSPIYFKFCTSFCSSCLTK